MSRRSLLAVLAIAAAAGITWLAATRSGELPRLATSPRAEPIERISDDEIPLLAPSSTPGPRTDSFEVGERRLALPTPVVTATEPLDLVQYSGTIVLVHDGRRNERPNGEFMIHWSNADASRGLGYVEVVNGEWETEGYAQGTASNFVLEDRWAFTLEEGDAEILAANALHAIEAWTADTIRLHALDAQTGVELPEAEAFIEYRGRTYGAGAGRTTSLDDRPDLAMSYEVVRGPSPLQLEANLDWLYEGATSEVFVRAPGHAWSRVTLSFLGGGERLVHLQRGGDLLVQFVAPFPHVTSAELSTLAGESAAESPREGDQIEFASVPEGDYELVFRGSGVLPASRSVTIVAGSSQTEFVDEEPDSDERLASIEGTLVLPESWWWGVVDGRWAEIVAGEPDAWRADVAVAIEHTGGRAIADLVPLSEPGTWTWRASVLAGPCVVSVEPMGYSLARVVSDGDRVELVLPELLQVYVSSRSENGEGVALDDLVAWHEDFDAPFYGASNSWQERFHESTAGPSYGVVSLPPGRAVFRVGDDGLRTDPIPFDVTEEGQVIELLVRPTQGVDLAFRNGASFVVFDACELGAFEGTGSVAIERCYWNGNVLRLELAQAGSVSLSFPTGPTGFAPIDDLVIDVPFGEFVEHEVLLKPSK